MDGTLVRILVIASLGMGVAEAETISGNIVNTKVILEDSRLTGNVTCNVPEGTPCIQFGADRIGLSLNGFTMTGKADPNLGCNGTSVPNEIGIDTNGRRAIEIDGPGLVQQFRFSGVNLQAGGNNRVKRLTLSLNCFAGISLFGSSTNDIDENILIKNGNIANGCGGIELNPLSGAGSDRNRIRLNVVSGNGYSDPTENDFGIAIQVGSDNLIEQNTVVGNTIGIRLGAAAARTALKDNLVFGNPPIQVSNSFPGTTGIRADIRNLSPDGATSFENNSCLTYVGAGPNPCRIYPVPR
jgi:parallel beta-helix repeat protein